MGMSYVLKTFTTIATLALCLTACGDTLQDGRSVGHVTVPSPGLPSSPNAVAPPPVTVTATVTPNCTQLGAALPALQAGGSFSSPPAALTLDGNAAPVVAWSVGNGLRTRPVYVSRLQRGSWAPLGTSDPNGMGDGNGGLSLATTPQGTPAVAWLVLSPNATGYFLTWDGAQWNGVGGSQKFNASNPGWGLTANSREPRMLLGYRSVGPMVSWSASYTMSGSVTTAQWDGSTWFNLPNVQVSDNTSVQASLAVGGDMVAMAVNGPFPTVQLLDANNLWVDTNLRAALADNGNVLGDGAVNPSVAVTSSGLPLIAWEQNVGGLPNVYVYVSDANHLWTPLAAPRTDGGLPFPNASHPSLAVDGQGRPVVAFEDTQLNQIALYRWDNTTQWQAVKGLNPNQPITANTGLAAWPVLRAAAQSDLIIAWYSDNASVRVCKLTPP